jgi:hypothetical protein
VLVSLPIEALTAILAGSVVFLVWHLEVALERTKGSLSKLDMRVAELEATQARFIEATNSLSQGRLGRVFGEVASRSPRVGFLRVYAISSQQILSFVKFHDFSIEKCHVLIRGFEEEDTAHADFLGQIRLVVADWQRLRAAGRIGELEIRYYDFLPTEYECIFDRESLVLGLYDSDPADYSEVSVRDPILIKGSSDGGRVVISEFVARFDNLFETCKTHHGPTSIMPSEGSK